MTKMINIVAINVTINFRRVSICNLDSWERSWKGMAKAVVKRTCHARTCTYSWRRNLPFTCQAYLLNNK